MVIAGKLQELQKSLDLEERHGRINDVQVQVI
jgi:hypothetical protein